MRTKRERKICLLSFIFVLGMLSGSCKKEEIPVVTTAIVSSVTQTTAISGGTITSKGSSTITQQGVCWSTMLNPTIADNIIIESTGNSSYASNITGLNPFSLYFVRAYATNGSGTGYGVATAFITLPVKIPVLTTANVTSVQQNSATCGGTISDDGGAPVIERGICWSISQNPTIANNKTSNGTGTGSFTSSLTGLMSNTLYYVRAYSTNSAGTSYGDQVSFTTNPGVPLISTSAVSAITPTSLLCGGHISNDGGAAVTTRGVCYSKMPNPTIESNLVQSGVDTGRFVSSITGLTPNTAYYIRAFATNIYGTAYGEQLSFTTQSLDMIIIFNPNLTYGTINDIDNNSYKTIPIGTQVWMAENLRVTKYCDGTSIPLITNAGVWNGLASGAYCNYSNDPIFETTFGHLYNFYAVIDSRKLCPSGWHVPSDAEWTTLTDYLIGNSYGYQGSGSDIAKSMAGTNIWMTYTTAGTVGNDMASNNSSGFTALPGGLRNLTGIFVSIGMVGCWWSSTVYTTSNSWLRILNYNFYEAGRTNNTKSCGLSVRCVKD
jgi:uncharacterized protein (TIGR02145 family)